MKNRNWKIGIVVVAAMLLCTACGGNGKTTTTAETTTTVPTTTTTKTPTTTVSKDADGALLVNMPDGKVPDSELLGRLSAVCRAHDDELSVYYKDLETGYSVEFRADEIYQTASVIKAPYVKYLLASDVDLDKKLTLENKQGGSAYIDKQPIGTQFTVKELMEYAIRYSDNSAYYMLNKEFGFVDFNAYADTLGILANKTRNCVLQFSKPRFGYLSARDAGLYFEDIARYIEKGSERATWLKQWLTTTTVEGLLPEAYSGTTYSVAHKYGLQDYGEAFNRAYHDAAIVYAPHPYVLSITTNMEAGNEADEVFRDVALLIDSIQTQLYQG